MVNLSPLDATFVALADPIRRSVLTTLAEGERSVSALAAPHRISLPAFLKHLRMLERAGLISATKVGRVRHCRLVADPLLPAADWIAQYRHFWNGQLDALDRFLQTATEETPWTPPAPSPPPRNSNSGERTPRRANASSTRGPKRPR